jgi:dienelactone hydrolase
MGVVGRILIGLLAWACASGLGPVARAADGPAGSTLVELPGIGLGPGQSLQGALFRPAGDGPFPAIVAMHGCGGLIQAHGGMFSRDLVWARELREEGFIVLFIDSFRSRGFVGGCNTNADGPPVHPWSDRPRDAYVGLAYLQARADVLPEHIGLIGWSHGGASVMFTVATDDEARPAALPHGDFRAAVSFYPGWCRPGNLPPTWAPAMPLLVLMGAADNWVTPAACAQVTEAAAKAGAPVETVLYPGAFHDFDGTDPVHTITLYSGHHTHGVSVGMNPEAKADAIRRVAAFFAQHVKPAP